MSLEQRRRQVQLAETECTTQSRAAGSAWQTLKAKFGQSATPWRIVMVGAIAGFVVGRGGTAEKIGARFGVKLAGTLAQALITALGAGVAAGVGAEAGASSAAGDAVAKDGAARDAAPNESRTKAVAESDSNA